jgi:predicted DsbA family dithiol-disulfide isomerase
MQIDVFSDPICPWCFIGKRRLERALAARPSIPSTINWRAFQLNPAMPAAGMDRSAYLTTKFGSATEADRLYRHIGQVGALEGLEFCFDVITVTPNTIDAHRLIRFAGLHECQNAVAENLFSAYFLRGLDIGDRSILLEIGEDVGLDTNLIDRYLSSTEDVEAVRNEDMHARQIGIEGVPCFIVNGRYALSGAQEPEAFFSLFDMVQEEARQATL